MKVGSLVECIKMTKADNPDCRWVPLVGEIYTIRGIEPSDTDDSIILVAFEENTGGFNSETGSEIGFPINYFREVQPPIDLTELLKESIKL